MDISLGPLPEQVKHFVNHLILIFHSLTYRYLLCPGVVMVKC